MADLQLSQSELEQESMVGKSLNCTKIAISKLFLDAVFATLMYFVFSFGFEFFMGLIVIVVGVILKL